MEKEVSKVYTALELLRQMADGKVLSLTTGYKIGMSENGFVGFVVNGMISTFSEVSFSQLVDMCEVEQIIVIPKN